jgi:glycosyltransferase involved in cell wall biosynthesis
VRIALISDVYLPRLGGIEMHVHDLAVQLQRAGHAVTVFTTTAGSTTANDVPVLRLPALAGLPTSLDALRRQVDKFDVIHAHTSFFSPLAWAATRIAADGGVPAVITLHSLPATGDVLLPRLLARVSQHAQWTGVSKVVTERLRSAVPAVVLHNGIEPEPWRLPPQAHRPLTIVSTMRLTQRKRPRALLHVLRAVRNTIPAEIPLRAVLIGAGPRAAATARSAKRLRLDWVELPGRLTRYEIQQLYTSADVYLAPAELESFGVAALEARCAGLPVIAMASGGVGEFVREGREGYLVGSHQEMAAVTADLLTDLPRLRKFQDHNRSTDPAMTWPAVIDQHVALYTVTQPALSAGYLPSKA